MSIESEIERIENNIANAYDVMENAGAEMPEVRNSANLASTASTIHGGAASLADIATAGRGIDFSPTGNENYTVVGTPTITPDYIMSDISITSYITHILDDYTYTTSEANILIKPTTLVHNNIFWSSDINVHLCINGDGKICLYDYPNDGWTDGITEYDVNTLIWVKLVKNNNLITVYSLVDDNYTLDTLPDILNWTQELTRTLDLDIYSSHTLFLGANSVYTQQYFKGNIYLQSCNLIIDNEEVWRAVTFTSNKTMISAVIPDKYLKNTASGNQSLEILGDTNNKESATSIGIKAYSTDYATSVGYKANASGGNSISIGYCASATSSNSIALGTLAHAEASGAIQLGRGTNTETKTFKVALTNNSEQAIDENTGLYTVLKSDGTIPFMRLIEEDKMHDQFAFQKNGMTIFSQSYTLDGETWEEDTKNLNKLFIEKDTGTDTTILNTNEVGYTFTLTSNQFRYSEIECFALTTAWVNPASKFTLKIEKSVDNETWDMIVEKTELKEQKVYYIPTSSKVSGETAYIRFTFTKTSNLDTGKVVLLSLRALTMRLGGQGMAREFAYPLNWDEGPNVFPLKNNTSNLGSSSYKWKTLYATTANITSLANNAITIDGKEISNLYYYKIDTGNSNNYKYRRIAHMACTNGATWREGGAIVEIISNYKNGYYGKAKIGFRIGANTTDPYATKSIQWLERYGFDEDALQAGFYTYTDGANSSAYMDVFLKIKNTYECYQIKIVKGNRNNICADTKDTEGYYFIFHSSKESDNDTTITEAYTAIQGTEAGTAAYDLHSSVQYTEILTAEDSTCVKEAKQIYTPDLYNKTVDLNNLFSKTVGDKLRYKSTNTPWSANISNKPYDTDMFTLESETLRYINDVRVIYQVYHSGIYKKNFYRYGTGDSSNAPDGLTWTQWFEEVRDQATGTNSISLSNNPTTANYAINIGDTSKAAINSVAYGYAAEAGTGGTAIGRSAKATGLASVAVGYAPTATKGGSIMLGNGTNTEENTFKVALTSASSPATNEESGLFTLLNSDGTIPVNRLKNLQVSDMAIPGANITLEKPFINVEKYGNDLVINNSVISNFTTSSYVSTINAIDLQRNFEFYIKVNSGEFTTCATNSYFIGSETNYTRNFILGFNKTSKKLALYLSSDGSTSDIASNKSGTYVFSENTNYKFKITFDGTYYKVYYSLDDGETYVEDISVENSSYLSTQRIDFGIHENRTQTMPADASIDFSQTYITSNGSIIWQGYYPNLCGISAKVPRRVLDNTALGNTSLAIEGTTGTGVKNTLIGNGSTITSSNQGNTGIGYGVNMTSSWSVAIGQVAKAQASTVIAIGSGAKCSGARSTSIGADTNNSGAGSILIGNRAVNSENSTFKVALNDSNNNAIDESTGLYTLLKSNGTIPAARLATKPNADGIYIPALSIVNGVESITWVPYTPVTSVESLPAEPNENTVYVVTGEE